jgi:hypothetical protein
LVKGEGMMVRGEHDPGHVALVLLDQVFELGGIVP